MEKELTHTPVLLEESLSLLNPQRGWTVVDCTLGLGGHAMAIAKRIGPMGHLIGMDRDASSIKKARENLQSLDCHCELIKGDFRYLDEVLDSLRVKEVNGFLFDLGISSFQLDDSSRGFSLKGEGPLDMRMDQEGLITAYNLINSLSEREISFILKNYGEERWYRRIARHLVQQREKAPIETTRDFAKLIVEAIPPRYRHQRIHPATRAFQAFRIAVNRELDALEVALDKCERYLACGGRICVISFHSLEDRIVKQKFRSFVAGGRFKLLVRKPLRPSEEEIKTNLRARSARLRAIERIL